MTVYYLKQDDTIWGCGDPECCGEYYEEIGEYFLECTCEVEVDADHLHSCNGGGPVLEWREATDLEELAYRNGNQEGYSEGSLRGWDFAVKETEERIIKLLEGLEQTAFDNYKANRTGEYGEGVCVGISGAIALIKGEK